METSPPLYEVLDKLVADHIPEHLQPENLPALLESSLPERLTVDGMEEAEAALKTELTATFASLDVDGDLAVDGVKIEVGGAVDLAVVPPLTKSIIDPSKLPNGPLTKATTGVFHGVPTAAADNTVIDNGAITFLTPSAGGDGTATTHIHLETPDGQKIQYMRAIVQYPVGANTPVTFVFPAESWLGIGYNAGVHTQFISNLSGTPAGRIDASGYPAGAPVNVPQRSVTLATVLPGRTVDIEQWFDKTTGRVLIYINGKKENEYTDADAIAYVSKYGDLEISGAGSASSVAPRIRYFEIDSQFNPPAEIGSARASSNVATAVTVGTAFADINSGVFVPVVFPASGQLIVFARAFITQDSGKTLFRTMGDSIGGDTQTAATGAYSGEVSYMGRISGTPGKRVDVKLQAIKQDGGTATIRTAADAGAIVMTAFPIAPYTPIVEV